ncbi:MAG: efflux RND transporter periplasmic adaptor subunit [Flavobacteriales bacterium]|nr:efflux RND transporter periplasmic adaptor subunit [Flavobacteriales bacterium]
MNKTWKIILILLAAVIVLAVFARSCGGDRDVKAVQVEEAQLRSIVETVSASGKIQPETEVKIQSEVSGQIIELPVKEGDLVEKGQMLVKINPDIYNQALNRAEAALNSARSALASAKARLAQAEAQSKSADLAFQRSKKLKDEGAISAAEFENATSTWETSTAEVTASKESIHAAEFNIASAQASRTEAGDNLSRTTITAPMSGTVTALAKEVGESVLGNSMMAGDVIMRVSALNAMEVNVEVNESDIVRVSVGDTATVEVDSYQDDKFKGVVTEIGNTALNQMSITSSTDQVTNFSVKIRVLPESYTELVKDKTAGYSPFRPGMSATVDIQTDRSENVLTVPLKSVTSREDTTSASAMEQIRRKAEEEKTSANKKPDEPYIVVFVVNETKGEVEVRAVKTGVQDDEFIYIKEGLKSGEKVVSGPYEEVARKLKPKDKVRITSKDEDEEKKEE